MMEKFKKAIIRSAEDKVLKTGRRILVTSVVSKPAPN